MEKLSVEGSPSMLKFTMNVHDIFRTNKSLKQAAKVLVQYITCNPHRAEDEGWRDATLVSLL
jgi:hypothetical protein